MLIFHVSLKIVFTREPASTDTTHKWLLASMCIQMSAPLGLVQEQFGTERASIVCCTSPGSVFPRGLGLRGASFLTGWGAMNGK